MVYELYDKESFEAGQQKNSNICVLHNFSTNSTPTNSTPTTPVVKNPTVTPEVTPPLNAAGDPVEEESEEVSPEITPEQTETQAGPGMWIFLLLAFIFSSAWTAWKKQKI